MMYWKIRNPDSYLIHYGVKDMTWGVRRTPEQLGHKESAKQLSEKMIRDIRYAEYSGLKPHDEVAKTKSSDCHSQVMYEYEELSRAGYKPKAKFFIEIDPTTNEGGTTHSFVYFQENGKTIWFENAWGGQEGLHEFSSEKEMMTTILNLHRKEQVDKRFSQIEVGDFIPEKHHAGESLQDLVNIVFDEEN